MRWLCARLKKSFGEFSLDAELTVTGTRLGIFGVSGSGKSTMVNLLAGTLNPDHARSIWTASAFTAVPGISMSRRKNGASP